jgi:hypothetical protein
MSVLEVHASANIIGTIVPPYPDGWKGKLGACISHSLGTERICDFSVGISESTNGSIVYVGRKVSLPQAKDAQWLVTDAVIMPSIPAEHYIASSVCQRNRNQDETIVAVVKPPKKEVEWHNKVYVAYKVNLNTGRFEKISSKGIRCLNEGWGL